MDWWLVPSLHYNCACAGPSGDDQPRATGPRRTGARQAVVLNGASMRGGFITRAAAVRMTPSALPVHCYVHRIRRSFGLAARCSRYVLFALAQAERGRATKGRGSSVPAARRTVGIEWGETTRVGDMAGMPCISTRLYCPRTRCRVVLFASVPSYKVFASEQCRHGRHGR